MMHPYATIEYGESLRHLGEPVYIPEWGTTVLRRECGLGNHDTIGTYPITVLKRDCDLLGGLTRLARLGFVAIVLVVDDVLRPELVALRQAFDFVRPFKCHYLCHREAFPTQYSRNHRYKIRRAARVVDVARFDLMAHLDDWNNLYQSIVVRHGLANTMHAFPSAHHEVLARLPGTVAIGAFANERLVSCHIWMCHDEYAMSHLVASNHDGYALRAAYAVNAGSIDLLSECKILNFGGTAGVADEAENGLARFKRGFSNSISPAYLCGKVLARDVYNELSRRAGVPCDAAYFPAYRQPVSQRKA